MAVTRNREPEQFVSPMGCIDARSRLGLHGVEVDAVSYTHLDVYKRQRYWTPSALRRLPLALGNRMTGSGPKSLLIHDRNAACVCLASGVQRSLRPFPSTWTWAPVPSLTSAARRPVISDRRSPV